MLSKLYYISQSTPDRDHVGSIEAACKAGCRLIQLRLKDRSVQEIRTTAFEVRNLCSQYGATFILNDYPGLAKEVNADGVHLGQHDMSPDEARKILGDDKIIGGTANSFDDVWRMANAGVDYLGAGPFRHTETKKNLSPILGVEGYVDLIRQSRQAGIILPVYAIGGILAGDVAELMQTGIHGIAVSGCLTFSNNLEQAVTEIETMLVI